MAVHPIVERILSVRGISPDGIESYLDTDWRRLAAPCVLPGMTEAVRVIMPYLREGRKIVVFGDYDCDGVCACAILVTTLRRLGAVTAEAFIPNRFTEGYGMTAASVARMRAENPDAALVITVDNGITSAAEVASLKEAGLAVVVTDHHLPPEELPVADALVDPKVASADGCDELCGAGIAFFLSSALSAAARAEGLYTGEKFGMPLLVLAGLATVADIVPLTDQNRIVVANALKRFDCAPVGLRELRNRAAKRAGDVTARDFGFMLTPRINAPGRLADAREAYELLMAKDGEDARRLAFLVDMCNDERKGIENLMAEDAEGQIPHPVPAAVVVTDEKASNPGKWHAGVSGIVASRLQEKNGVPAAVVVNGRGSVRVPKPPRGERSPYDVHAALAAAAETLDRFGGHAAAGGFTLKDGRYEDFVKRFTAACEEQALNTAADGKPASAPDLWVQPGDITLELYDALRVLEPYGEGNEEPVFGIRGVTLSDIRTMKDGQHISFSVSRPDDCVRTPPLRAVWWKHGFEEDRLRKTAADRFDVLFTVTASDWGGAEPHAEIVVSGLTRCTEGA